MYSFSERREAISELAKRNQACATSSHYYEVERERCSEYFCGPFRSWRDEIVDFSRQVKSEGQHPIHLDVCGNTVATDMEIDKSVQISMQRPIWTKGNAVVYRANIFARSGIRPILEEVVRVHGRLSLTTFLPLAGLQAFMTLGAGAAYRALVYDRLFHQLEQIVKVTRVGGYIYLERPFKMDEMLVEFIEGIPIEKRLSHIALASWAKKFSCSVRVRDDIRGPKWLLRVL